MTPDGPRMYRCVSCGNRVTLTVDRRCVVCGVSYQSPAAQAVIDAERSLAQIQHRYDELVERREQWTDYRARGLEALRLTIPEGWVPQDGSNANADAVAQQAATVADAPVQPAHDVVPDLELVEPEPLAPVSAVPISTTPAHMPRQPRPASQTARKAMSAPALLGVAGASLLIAASIVFVALAWTLFSPLTRGLIVSGVAAMVAGIAVWLRRMDLTISSGAVGVVAMGFAGTATLAFSRDSGALGGYDTPTALLVVCLAGLALSRLKIQWVGSAAGLAFAGAAIGYTIAATHGVSTSAEPGSGGGGVRGIWVWIVVGTASAIALAWSHRWWTFVVARVVSKWVAVVWLTVVGVGAAGWIWVRDGIAVDAAVAVIPVIALAVLARRWPTPAVGPAAFLVTLLAPAAASTVGAGGWQQATAAAVAAGTLLAVGPRLPERMRTPLLVGVSPGYLTVAIASAGYSILITVTRIIAGTYVPDTQMWAGAAALVAGISVALLRTWKATSPWTTPASVMGALMVVTGLGIVAFGAAEAIQSSYHSSVAFTMTVAAVLLLISTMAWANAHARWVTTSAAMVFAVVAGGHAAAAIPARELSLGFAYLLAIAPIGVLVWQGRRSRWWGITPVIPLLGWYGLAFLDRAEASWSWQALAAVVVTTLVLWGVLWVPRSWQGVSSWHGPVAVGAIPALAFGLASVLFSAQSVLAYLTTQLVNAVGLAWVMASLATGLALAAIVRMDLPEQMRRTAGVAGAVAVLAAASSAVYTTAHAVTPGQVWILPSLGVVAAVVSTLFMGVWRSRAAIYTNGIGAVGIATIAGLHGAVLAGYEGHWWPALVAALVSVVLMLVAARWWPRFTLGSASMVMTAVVAALALRWWGPHAAVVGAVLVAAAVLWLVGLPRVRFWISPRSTDEVAGPAAWGTAPAMAVGATVVAGLGVMGVVAAVANEPYAGPSTLWWSVATVAVMLVALRGAGRLLGRDERNPAGESPVSLASGVTVVVGVITLTVAIVATVLPAVADLDDTRLYWAGVGTAATLLVAGGALALTHARRPYLGVTATGQGRSVVRVGVIAWLTVHALALVANTSSSSAQWLAPVVAVAAVLAALVVMARWWPLEAMASVSLVSTWAAYGLLTERVGFAPAVAAASAVGVAILWWMRRDREEGRTAVWVPAMVGLVPVVSLAAFVSMLAVADVVAMMRPDSRWVVGSDYHGLWYSAVVVMVAAGMLSWRWFRQRAGSTVVVTAILACGAVPPGLAAVVLAALTFAAVLARPRVVTHEPVIGVALGASLLLGWQRPVWLAVAAVVATGTLLVLARSRVRDRQHWSIWAAPVASAVAGFAALDAIRQPTFAGAVSMALVGTVVFLLAAKGWDYRRKAMPIVLSVATVSIPAIVAFQGSDGALRSGMALLVAGVAWAGAVRLGETSGRWLCAATLSVGTGLLMAQADIRVIEAYTAVPALAALILGLQWMRAEPEVRSLAALWPGLVLALVPSYIALVVDPDVMIRTVLLTVAIVALAAVGVTFKWFAPILATAVTAVVVSALQMIVGTHLVWRLISFLVVGSLLLAVASWFERIKNLR